MVEKRAKLKILITGSSGFIGRNFIQQFYDRADIFAIVRKLPSEKVPRVQYVIQDLSRILDIGDLKPDVIVHLAHAGTQDPFDLFNVNVKSTFELLEYGRKQKIQKFIYASTGSVYGYGKKPFPERSLLAPFTLYGASKAAAEELVWQYNNYFDVNIIRIFTPYGPGQQSQRLIPSLIYKIENDQPIIVNNKIGNPRLTPLYISDLIQILERVIMTKGSYRMNAAGTSHYSVRVIAELIGKIMRKKPSYSCVVNKKIGDLMADIKLMKKILKFQPKVKLEEGLKLCIK